MPKDGVVGAMGSVLAALRAGHWPSLVGAWVHFEVSFMAWVLIGALGVLIADDFGLTATQKGLLVGVPLLGGAFFRVLVGIASDRFGTKPTGLVLLVGQGAVLLWGWLGATSYGEVLGVGPLLGLAGASFAVALPLAGRVYPPSHRGLAMGVAAWGNSGVVLAAFFAPRLGEMVGWHGVFGLMAVPVLLTAVLFAKVVRSEVAPARHEEGWWRVAREGLRRPSMYWLGFLYAVTFGGFVGLLSFLPIFFHDQYGLNPVAAGTTTALCGLAGSAIRPVGGYFADRRGGLLLLRFLFPLLGLLIVGVGQLPGYGWAASLLVTALACMGFGNGVVFQVVSDRFPKHMGMATGLIGAAGGLGGFLLPSALGLLRDVTGTYMTGFILFTLLVAVAGITVELAIRRRRLVMDRVTPFGSISH